jgi:hypothetical protein
LAKWFKIDEAKEMTDYMRWQLRKFWPVKRSAS